MRKVPVWALEPGMKIARPVYCSQGTLLLNAGLEIKSEYIKHMQRLGILSVYIRDNIIPGIEIEDIILDETRQEAKKLISDFALEVQREQKFITPKISFAHQGIKKVLKKIIDQLLANPNLIINLSDIRTADSYTFAHSVNVAVMALTTGITLQIPLSRLLNLGIGALLHDLGKVKIPIDILNKKGKLTPEEYEEIKKHPRYGYEMYKTQRDYMSATSALVIYQHHERMNGEGYPENLRGKQIHAYARICAVADVYDALVADRPYRQAFQPHVALQIMGSAVDEFDPDVLRAFFQHIAAYPIGTLVGLSNGLIGVVIHNQAGFSFRPKVMVLGCKEKGRFEPLKPYELNLMEKIDIIIDEVYSVDELPAAIIKRDKRLLKEKR
ncbi:MAG: HD-GYP domain-containing protein [Firmicutes bacterium]|nr:HD-GYP domain-containing protein [Bacillota bacterium]